MQLCNVPCHLPLCLLWAGILGVLLSVVWGDFTGTANSSLFLMFLCGWLDLSENTSSPFWVHVAHLHMLKCFFVSFLLSFLPWCNFHVSVGVESVSFLYLFMLSHRRAMRIAVLCWGRVRRVLLVSCFSEKLKNILDEWWEHCVWRSQRDLPCYPSLPFVHGVGSGEACPPPHPHSFCFIRCRY